MNYMEFFLLNKSGPLVNKYQTMTVFASTDII